MTLWPASSAWPTAPSSLASRHHPGSVSTFCQGINSHRWIAGYYSTEFLPEAFVFIPPYQFIDYVQSGVYATYFTGINDSGRVTGYYVDNDGNAPAYPASGAAAVGARFDLGRHARCEPDHSEVFFSIKTRGRGF